MQSTTSDNALMRNIVEDYNTKICSENNIAGDIICDDKNKYKYNITYKWYI